MADEALGQLANGLKDCIERLFVDKFEAEFFQESEVVEKDLIDYDGYMRTIGLDKFNAPCYLTVTNFYLTEQQQEKKDSLGALVLYFNDETIETLFKRLRIRPNMEDEELTTTNFQKLTQMIVDSFIGQAKSATSSSLIASEPILARDDLAQGVPFHRSQYSYYEVGIYLWKHKALVASLTMKT